MREFRHILDHLTDEDIEWLIESGACRTVPADEVVVREGAVVEHVMFVIDGRFSVMKSDDRLLAEMGPGDVIGEVSFLDADPASATVRAIQGGRLFLIEKSRLATKAKEDLFFAARFYRALGQFLARRLRATDEIATPNASIPESAEGSSSDADARCSDQRIERFCTRAALRS
jgi:CRP/FNR family cyclic AMP-dependent transcriptional regulator